MEKYLFDEDMYGNCLQKCNVLNDGTMIGSVKCQACKYCISVAPHCEFTGSVEWVVCSKIDKAIKLKNLDEHNAQASNTQLGMNSGIPTLNGIACPECGEELYDSFPMITLTSMPAQKNVNCSKCDYVGYRIA